jgi:hypothetical protein
MIAKFASTCTLCHGTIAKGDSIRPVSLRGFVHASCPAPPGADKLFDAAWRAGAFAPPLGRQWVEEGAAPAKVTLEHARELCDRWGVAVTLLDEETGEAKFEVGYKILIPLS